MKKNNPVFPLQCARRKNIGLGICAWDEITPKNLARFCTSIKYLIISLALFSSEIMAAAGRFGCSSDIDIEAILAEKDCKSTTNSTKVALMCLNLLNSTYLKLLWQSLIFVFEISSRIIIE